MLSSESERQSNSVLLKHDALHGVALSCVTNCNARLKLPSKRGLRAGFPSFGLFVSIFPTEKESFIAQYQTDGNLLSERRKSVWKGTVFLLNRRK